MTSDFSDELEALFSIYPNHIVVLEPSCNVNGQYQKEYVTVQYSHKELSSEENSANLIWTMDSNYVLTLNIPTSYPIIDVGMDKITLSLSFTKRMDSEVRESILHELYQVIDNNAGEVIIYLTIQRLLEMMDSYNEVENHSAVRTSTMPLALEITTGYDTGKVIDTSVFTDRLSTRIGHLNIIHGPVTTEQKSSFQAHICSVRSMDDVAEFRTLVLSDKRVARATHNIFAYRFSCDSTAGDEKHQHAVIYHDYDDDGETAAGGRLAEMMRLMGVQNVAVIVSRWFGGILLGPDRFKYICNAARNLLEQYNYAKAVKR